MEFRSITNLEELTTLPADAKILVIDAGTAKQISKANAKFGGGAMVVTFTLDSTGLSADKTVEEVTAAMASTPVIGNLIMTRNTQTVTMHLGACCSEFSAHGNLTPAFAPFTYDSKESMMLGAIGVNSSGQWEARGA